MGSITPVTKLRSDNRAHGSHQGCSPRDRGLGLESTRDHFYAVLVLRDKVLVLILMVLVLKDWSRIFSRPVLYMSICFLGIFYRKKNNYRNHSLHILVWWVQLLLNFKGFHGHRLLRAAAMAASVISISIRYDAFELSMAFVDINCCIMCRMA